MYNIRVIARKAKLVGNHTIKGAWFSPGFACLRIKAWVASYALGENHAHLGAWFLLNRPFKGAWFSQ